MKDHLDQKRLIVRELFKAYTAVCEQTTGVVHLLVYCHEFVRRHPFMSGYVVMPPDMALRHTATGCYLDPGVVKLSVGSSAVRNLTCHDDRITFDCRMLGVDRSLDVYYHEMIALNDTKDTFYYRLNVMAGAELSWGIGGVAIKEVFNTDDLNTLASCQPPSVPTDEIPKQRPKLGLINGGKS